MKDRRPKRYESFVKFSYSSLKENHDKPIRAHVGTRKGNDTDFTKTVYRQFETVRRITGIPIPKPLFDARVYIAEKRAANTAARLNRQQALR